MKRGWGADPEGRCSVSRYRYDGSCSRRVRTTPDRSSLRTDKSPRRRGGTPGPAAAAAAWAHKAGSAAGYRGAEPRGLAPRDPQPSCGKPRAGRLERQRRRSHEGRSAGTEEKRMRRMRRMRRRPELPAAAAAARTGRARPGGRRQRAAGTGADSRAVATPGPERVGGAEEGRARGLPDSQVGRRLKNAPPARGTSLRRRPSPGLKSRSLGA